MIIKVWSEEDGIEFLIMATVIDYIPADKEINIFDNTSGVFTIPNVEMNEYRQALDELYYTGRTDLSQHHSGLWCRDEEEV